MKKLLIFGFITLFTLVSFNGAEAVPYAMTTVIKSCRIGYLLIDREESRGKTYEQDISCDLSFSGGGKNYSAVGRANAGFGSGFPVIGNVNIDAEARGDGEEGAAIVGFTASVYYYFEVEPIHTPPVIPREGIPVFFTARGEGSVTPDVSLPGYWATAEGSAYLQGRNLPLPVGFHFEGNDSFNDTVSVNVFPGLDYGIELLAGCAAMAGGSANCSAAVDPIVGFDQAGFDRIMGENTFVLKDYYGFVFSENLPSPHTDVPEPAIMFLLGSGLLALAGYTGNESFKK